MNKRVTSVTFAVAAAKGYSDDEGQSPNWKYIEDFPTFAAAADAFEKWCTDYPIKEFTMDVIYSDMTMTKTDVFDGRVLHFHMNIDKGFWEPSKINKLLT